MLKTLHRNNDGMVPSCTWAYRVKRRKNLGALAFSGELHLFVFKYRETQPLLYQPKRPHRCNILGQSKHNA